MHLCVPAWHFHVFGLSFSSCLRGHFGFVQLLGSLRLRFGDEGSSNSAADRVEIRPGSGFVLGSKAPFWGLRLSDQKVTSHFGSAMEFSAIGRGASWIRSLDFGFSPPRHRRSNLSRFRQVLWVFLLLQCRVGEAKQPGPDWTLGLANPNGLNTKAFAFADSKVDSWIFCETHLTRPASQKFFHTLKGAGAHYKSFVTGHPVAARSTTSDLGMWSGVGVLSRFPVRKLPHQWPEVAYQSGRLCCVAVCSNHIWVQGCVLYGTPTGPTHPQGRAVTNDLLGMAIERATLMGGPAFIAGDLNHDLDHLKVAAKLTRLGFQDVQDLHMQLTGELPQATCRRKTRRDFVFVNRALAQLFLRCEVIHETVSDHSFVVGHFRGGPKALERFPWPIPDQMDWVPPAERHQVDFVGFQNPDQATLDFSALWTQIEDSNVEARRLKGLLDVRAMRGRACQHKPVKRSQQVAPPKASRPGDRQPIFLGSCLQHAQWLRQSRRLQSLVRLLQAEHFGAAHVSHATSLWAAILRSPGFVPSFSVWWSSRALAVGEPSEIPSNLPSLSVAQLLCAGMSHECEQLELCLRHSRSAANRLCKASDAHAMYRAVRRDVPAQVDSLATTIRAQVVDVDCDQCALELDSSVSWDPSKPLLHSQGTLQIIHADHDKVWVNCVGGILVGDEVWQQNLVGDLPALFDAFETHWKKLWSAHADVPASQWDAITAFAAKHLRPVHAPAPVVTVDIFRKTVKAKAKHAATGLDGISRLDLLSLRDDEVGHIISLLSLAQSSGCWPQQVLNGYVRSLAKVANPESVGHYRPITVFGIVYRTWSTVVARHWLAAVSQVVDPFLCGSTTGNRAAMIWRHVLETVETSAATSADTCGFVADLTKAYNMLPRIPTLRLAKLVGIDHGTLLAWAGALGCFRRHFLIQGSCSNGVFSSKGFPEGCALSCLGMVLLTEVFHRWLRCLDVPITPLSFVDNWEFILTSPSHMKCATDALDQLVDLLGLKLDSTKSYTWGTSRATRHELRAAGFKVCASARDLGAHVVYTRQLVNQTSLDRFANLQDFWDKLGSAKCTYLQKIQLVVRVAWPRAFHAVSAVVIGKKRFGALRTQLLQAMQTQKPGVNPELQCALDGVLCDPFVFAAIETIRDFRSLGVSPASLCNFDETLFGDGDMVHNSISEILGQRLHRLGFWILPGGLIGDDVGSFDLTSCPFEALLIHLNRVWTRTLAAVVRHRRSFASFERVDLGHTRKAYQQLDSYDQGIMRRSLTGAHMTNAHAHNWSDDASKLCVLCGANDSAAHRLWSCPSTEHLRQTMPPDFLAEHPSLPAVMSVHGWSLDSVFRKPWLQYLDSLDCVPQFLVDSPVANIVDLFTDGSCLFPESPDVRVAAWAVVMSPPLGLDQSADCIRPIAAQPLSGIGQTAFRAEIKALLVAIQFVVTHQVCARIWVDCQGVIDRFHAFVRNRHVVKHSARNADLWTEMQQVVGDFDLSCLQVLKVPAHVNRNLLDNEFDRWLALGNDCADRAAKMANQVRTPEAWGLWSALVDDLNRLRGWATLVRQHILDVSKIWGNAFQTLKEQPSIRVAATVRTGKIHATKWEVGQDFSLRKPTFQRSFGEVLAAKVFHWLEDIVAADQAPYWVSYLQLYASFQQKCGPVAIWKDGKKWKVDCESYAVLHNRFFQSHLAAPAIGQGSCLESVGPL
eukprot:s1099_g13.t1